MEHSHSDGSMAYHNPTQFHNKTKAYTHRQNINLLDKAQANEETHSNRTYDRIPNSAKHSERTRCNHNETKATGIHSMKFDRHEILIE